MLVPVSAKKTKNIFHCSYFNLPPPPNFKIVMASNKQLCKIWLVFRRSSRLRWLLLQLWIWGTGGWTATSAKWFWLLFCRHRYQHKCLRPKFYVHFFLFDATNFTTQIKKKVKNDLTGRRHLMTQNVRKNSKCKGKGTQRPRMSRDKKRQCMKARGNVFQFFGGTAGNNRASRCCRGY